jgi:cyclic pyranopterin phosphate synthase
MAARGCHDHRHIGGVRKLRLTGGEPLGRKGLMALIRSLSQHLDNSALDELTLSTNRSQLQRFGADLAACAIRRINVSLDIPRNFA